MANIYKIFAYGDNIRRKIKVLPISRKRMIVCAKNIFNYQIREIICIMCFKIFTLIEGADYEL